MFLFSVVGSALTKSSVNAPASLTSTIEERINCWVEHRAAIESSKDGGVTTYIPECKPDGRFQSVQCYKVFAIKSHLWEIFMACDII